MEQAIPSPTSSLGNQPIYYTAPPQASSSSRQVPLIILFVLLGGIWLYGDITSFLYYWPLSARLGSPPQLRLIVGVIVYAIGLWRIFADWRPRSKASQCSVALQETGVLWHDGSQQRTIKWRSISDVTRSRTHVGFWRGNQPGIFVPTTAFATPQETLAFFNRAQQLWKAAKMSSPPIASVN